MLVLFHDYTSPASAVAVARVERLIADGVRVEIVGTDVLGLQTTLPVTVQVLAEWEAVADAAAAEGIALRRPTRLPPTASAHLLADLAHEHGRGTDWRRACYRAVWSDGADIADLGVLRALADGVGLPRATVDDLLGDRIALLAIRRRFAGHRRDGIGGVPMISYDRTLVPGLLDEPDLRALAALAPEAP